MPGDKCQCLEYLGYKTLIASSFFPLNESQILLLWPRFPKNDVTLIIEFQDECFHFLPTLKILECKNQLIIGLGTDS